MSGIIDRFGQQFERCCQCGEFVRLKELEHAHSPAWPEYNEVDICRACLKRNEGDKVLPPRR